jgi:cytochrome P450
VSVVTIDVTDPDAFVRQEHHAMLAWLRENDPVHWHRYGDGGFWALTRYDDLLTAYRDHTTFSSAGGAMLGGSFRSEADTASNRMLVASDPPRQRLLRQQMHPLFAHDSVTQVSAQVTKLVQAAVDRALADGGCDFATDIAPELPAGALMAMMGLSYEQAHALVDMTRRMIGFRDPNWVDTSDDERLRLAGIQAEILEFFADIARERRRHPTGGDDVVSLLLRAELNGRPLPEADVLYNCMNVAVGGNETSSYTACSGAIALAENPDEWTRLRDDPGLLDSGINEILRWSSTNAYVQRVATRDVELHGRAIRKGDSVTLWNVSANRDERQFPRANEFRVDRSPNRHLTYGSGIHRCIGAPVAQVELPILFRELLDRKVRFTISGEVVRLRSNFILGVTHLPLTMEVA